MAQDAWIVEFCKKPIAQNSQSHLVLTTTKAFAK